MSGERWLVAGDVGPLPIVVPFADVFKRARRLNAESVGRTIRHKLAVDGQHLIVEQVLHFSYTKFA